jgi:hypothetical protein
MPASTLPLNADQLVNLALDNQQIPSEGSKSVAVLLDFTQSNQFTLDLTNIQQRGFLSMIQTLFIDMSASDVPMNILVNGSRQNLVAKGRTQGYYCVLAPNPVKLTFTCAGGPLGVVVYFINVPIPGAVWPTI